MIGVAMHELAITCNIVELVSEAARGRKVCSVTIELGRLSGVIADAIEFCFLEVSKGTLLEGARLNIWEIQARALCRVCGVEFMMPDSLTACPCGSRQFTRLCGDELIVKRIEIEAGATSALAEQSNT
jgi:hydrogenase nickel incorporation protein HypA/HybF